MKKSIAILASAVMVLFLVSCDSKKKAATAAKTTPESQKLVLSTFGLSEDVSEDEIYKPFEDKFNADIVTETGNASERYTKFAADSQSSVDVIELSQSKTAEGVKAGIFAAIDTSKIENYNNLIDSAKKIAESGAGIPYTMNSLVIVYDPSKTDAVKSYDDLWSGSLAGKISIPEITTTFGPAMVYIASDHAGVDITTDNGAAAFKALSALKSNIVKTYSKSSDLVNMFTSGEISAAVVGDYAVPILKGANPDLVFVTPEGAYGNFNLININKNSAHTDLAYKYINYRLSVDLQKTAVTALNNAPTNKNVVLTEDEVGNMPYGDLANAMKTIDYSFVNPLLSQWIDQWNRILNS